MQIEKLLIVLLCWAALLHPSESYYISPRGYFIGESGEHVTDWFLAEAMVQFLKKEDAESVVDFGCGDGDYVNFFIKNNLKAVGYDGNPVTESVSGGTCYVRDLSRPLELERKFDWVISLETGEHLPKQYETIFIDNLTRHVQDGLILSWAIPGQGGAGHFNEQPNNYIKSIFEDRGWFNDVEAENQLRERAGVVWFKNTIMVFRPKK